MLKTITTAFCICAASATLAAQTPAPKPHMAMKPAESQAALRKEAKISMLQARARALKEVPNGKVNSAELERENGKLIYSFDIKVPGKSGIEELNIDATSGAVIAHEHETPKAEAKEAAKEKKEKK